MLKKVPSVSGYEITYLRKKNGKIKTVIVSGWKNNVVILRNLRKGRYRIKAKTYLYRSGKRYYSKYSKLYKVKG